MGRTFENVVETLERILSDSKVSIESPGSLVDRVTNQKREIDVLLRFSQGHHKQFIAIECKDRKTPVGVPDVEAFNTKTCDLKITKAVMVSSSGFRKNAIEKARFYNISCLSVEEIEGFEWLGTKYVTLVENKILGIYFKIIPEVRDTKVVSKLVIRDTSGAILTNEVLKSNVLKFINEQDFTHLEFDKPYRIEVPVGTTNIYIEDTSTGKMLKPNEDAMFIVILVKVSKKVPFSLLSYNDTAENAVLTKAVIAPFTINENTMHLGIKENEDGTKQVFISPIGRGRRGSTKKRSPGKIRVRRKEERVNEG